MTNCHSNVLRTWCHELRARYDRPHKVAPVAPGLTAVLVALELLLILVLRVAAIRAAVLLRVRLRALLRLTSSALFATLRGAILAVALVVLQSVHRVRV